MRPWLDGERILVIEDDHPLRADLVMCLQAEGYQVCDCAAGLEAIELAHQQSFDLIISDLRMAGMDGLETLERLQQQQPTVATLVITGYTAEADSIRAVRLGVGDYLKKPFRLDAFLQTVVRLLQAQRVRMKRLRHEHGLRSLSGWALRGWLSQLDRGAPELEQAQLSEAVGQRLGLGREACDLTGWSVLVEACQRRSGRSLAPDLSPELLGVLNEISSPASEAESLTLSARIALTVKGQLEPESPLGEALQAARSQPQRQEDSPDRRRLRRSRLSLGRSLERSQEGEEARIVYESLTQEGGEDRERVEAWLGLMRISVAESRFDQARHFAQQATEAARNLNPMLHVLALLEAGLSMRKADFLRESSALLELARRLGKELAQPVLVAKATVADSGVSTASMEEALTVLLREENRYELLDAAGWMGPWLLQRQASQPEALQARMLRRLVLDAPSWVGRYLSKGNCLLEQRLALTEALAGCTHPEALDALKLLSVDRDSRVRAAAQVCKGVDESMGQAHQDPPRPPVLRIFSLGGFEVFLGDQRVPDGAFRSWKQRFLLSRLAAHPGLLSAERLMDEFWPEDGEGGRASLNVSFSHLRRILRPPQWPQELDYVIRQKGLLGVNSELPLWHDLNEFFRLAEGPSIETAEQLQRWQQAAALFRGPFLENCYLEWALTIRERVESRYLELLRGILLNLDQRQRYQEAMDYALRLLELEPCCQEAHLGIMRAHSQAGRHEAAVRQFEVARRALQRELQMEPSIALFEAHQRALLNL